ncbi:MAG: hypothetical protein A3J46_00905 [Candidatus Yanofskybacteria bacterium RIFCSPHIGHO2_02_FULL_41_11]|uniref:PD-(D/E)XK endonuclease-like domain-containing protein n=1 Tax=Candidatus Yanofskybacteria bacterium RIFCSPHIGHO2_02_FULL_41_11 TaxID=1802675 RepID=A0A1F8F4X4_9BACT|nr:MAG: hypothetical protein A3J46_00905 [Candidatus Yanofskybacteria bacterium RIFCSPHIGHO2_02_FULL_41_11]
MTWYKDINSFKEANGYTIDDLWYPRVTSIVSIKAKPALMYFYASLPDYKTGQAITQKSAEEGTLLHETIEAILRKEPVVIPDSVKPVVSAFMDFYGQNELIAHKIEERVVSKKHHYAGTMDVLAELNGRLGVLDIKTSVAIYRDYSMQTSAYIEALKEDTSIPLLTRWILRLDQSRHCLKCSATLRDKGGREKIRGEKYQCEHEWGPMQGEVELKELTTFDEDIKAFLACRDLWNWENKYWLDKIGNGPDFSHAKRG